MLYYAQQKNMNRVRKIILYNLLCMHFYYALHGAKKGKVLQPEGLYNKYNLRIISIGLLLLL